MKVLVVGSGGREHALVWKLSQSPRVTELFATPGNPGIGQLATCIPIQPEDLQGICSLVKRESIDFTVIGPEVPLAMGIVDALEAQGSRVFGPDASCARLEGSKSFTKAFLLRHGIPTARAAEFTDRAALEAAIGIFGFPMVIKADGLAAGKGVVIAADEGEARKAIQEMMGDRIFGAAGDRVVVEEFLTGTEASMLCFVDRHTIVPMESAQDYKKVLDGDKGPNTGGMGTYSPSLLFDGSLDDRIRKEILEPTLQGFQQDGLAFRGVLFVGLMLTEQGPKVIEFNNRFGDPETQSVLPRMQSDLLSVLEAVVDDRLSEQAIQWDHRHAVCVVLASGGYPGAYEKGKPIDGLDQMEKDILVFHAGTRMMDHQLVTDGGRVLSVTALGETLEEAREKVYRNLESIRFEGMQYRKEIGQIL